jgi:hypothetical protein
MTNVPTEFFVTGIALLGIVLVTVLFRFRRSITKVVRFIVKVKVE